MPERDEATGRFIASESDPFDVDAIVASLEEDEPDTSPDQPASEPASEAQPATEAVAAEATDAPDAQPDPDTPQATDAPAPSEPEPAETPETTEPPDEGEPFGFTADGTRVDIPGAVKRGDLIQIPVEAFQRTVQPYLRDFRKVHAREQQYQQALAQRGQREQVAELLVQKLDAIMQEPDERKAAEAFFKLRDGYPLAKKDVELAALKQQLQPHQEAAEQAALEITDEAMADNLAGWAEQASRELVDYQGITVPVPALMKALAPVKDQLYPVQRDATGQVVRGFNAPLFVHYYGLVAETERAKAEAAQQAKQAAEAAKKAADAARKNAQRQPAKQPPPAVPVRGAPTTAPVATKPQSWDDVLKDAESIDF